MNDTMLRALAYAYDREDAAQRGETNPWSIDDPGDIGDSEMWQRERIACARAGLDAFLSQLSGNPGELIEAVARAIRDDGSHLCDQPWEQLPEERKVGWRGDAKRALQAIKDYLTTADGCDA